MRKKFESLHVRHVEDEALIAATTLGSFTSSDHSLFIIRFFPLTLKISMELLKPSLFLLPLLFTFLAFSIPVLCNDKEDSVFKGLNSYRQTQKLAPLTEVSKAKCLADEVAEEIEKTPCENVNQFYPSTVSGGGNGNIPNLRKHIEKCHINISTTSDGVILPVCVAKLEPTIVLSNYTHSDRYAQFLNNSKYTGAGLGSEDDWMVLVLTTNTASGSFSASSAVIANAASVGLLLFAFLLLLINYFD